LHFVFCYFCAILYLLIVLFIHVLYLVYELNNNINTILLLLLQLIIINTRKAVQFWDTAKVKILSCLFLCSQLRGKSCYFDRKCSSNPLLPHCPPYATPRRTEHPLATAGLHTQHCTIATTDYRYTLTQMYTYYNHDSMPSQFPDNSRISTSV